MESINQQAPMLSVPLKVTDDVDFTQAFKKYILEHYQEDPDNYSNEIAILNRLRQDIRGVGKDMTGRDILYRYYGQLELLDLRFPLDEKHVKVLFTWYDAFSEEGISQYSGAYEKACVIFNIAAILSAIAATQNRFEEEGRKIAYNYFQASAGLFQFINDNFLHAPSIDIRRESVKCLNKLMLASAQECFLEKTIYEKKKANLLSKIASYLAFTYAEISDDMDVVELREQFDDSWTSLVKVKSKYYATISHYYKALASADEGKYGHIISYLTLAENFAKEANKLAKSFASNYPSFSVGSNDAQSASTGKSTSASQALFEATKAYLTLITDKKKQAIKDNDIVYQEIVPNIDTLEAPEKLCVVKNLNFVDICPNGQKEAQGIIGQDIFHRLIPIQVHEASSLYSEEKAKILRAEMDRCENADIDFQLLMTTQDIADIINKAKDALKNEGVNESMVSFPEEINTYCKLVQQENQAGKNISSTISSLNSLQTKAHDNLNNIGLELDKEQREYDLKLQLYNTKWTQESPITASTTIRQNLKKYRSSLEEAINADNTIITKYNMNKKNIDMLEQPIEKVRADYIESVLAGNNNNKTNDTMNLLDVNIDDVQDKKKKEKENIDKIETLIMNLKGCQGERKKLIEELKYKIQNDDISNILLIKKHKEKQVFQNELGKFQVFRDNISRNINDHSNFLHTLTEEFNQLKSNSDTFKSVNTVNEKKEQKNREFKEAFELWKEIYNNLESGIKCYTSLNEMIDNLKFETDKYINQRLSQRNDLEKRIKEAKAVDDQKILLSKLNSLNLGSNNNTPTTGTPYTPSLPQSNIKSPTTNYFATQPQSTNQTSYSFMNNATAPSMSATAAAPPVSAGLVQSPTLMQPTTTSIPDNNKPLSLVTSPVQTSTQLNSTTYQTAPPSQPQSQPHASLTTPLHQIPSSQQQTPLTTPLTAQNPNYNYSHQPSSQLQTPLPSSTTSSYLSYQQPQQPTQQQPQQPLQSQPLQPSQSLNMQNQTALKLQQALTSTQMQPVQSQSQQQPQQQPQQTTYQPQRSLSQTAYHLSTSSTSQPLSYQSQISSSSLTNYSLPNTTPVASTATSTTYPYQNYQKPMQQPQQPQQPVYNTTMYGQPQPQPQIQPQTQTRPQSQIQTSIQPQITNTYGNITTPALPTASNYTYQPQNTYNMYKPQAAVTGINTAPAIPPKPVSTQDPLSSQMVSPVRPPLPPPPGTVSFNSTQAQPTATTTPATLYGQPQPSNYMNMNYYAKPNTINTTTSTTAVTTNTTTTTTTPYGMPPQQPQQPQQPYYNLQQQQPIQQQPVQQQPIQPRYSYPGQQQPQQQNPYYQPPTQPQQPAQGYYPQVANTTPATYYQQPQQPQQPQPQQQQSSIAQVNSIQNQQLASLSSQYKPLQPQQYNQPSLLD